MPYAIAESIGPFRVDDRPLSAALFTIVDGAGNEVDLTSVEDVKAELSSYPNPDLTLTATVVGDTISIQWPAVSPFTVAGRYSLWLILETATGSARVEPLEIAVEADDGWVSLARARAEWRDAPADDMQLFDLLDVAKTQCLAFAPLKTPQPAGWPYPSEDVTPGEIIVPANYRAAQLMQARNLWNSWRSDPANAGYGDDGFVVRIFPMDFVVKNMLRPQRAVPVVA